jgi:hypothetical protein
MTAALTRRGLVHGGATVLGAKARWAVSAFEDGGSIDTLERFVRQVAAFGEVAS